MGTSTERNARRKKRRQSQKDREQDAKKNKFARPLSAGGFFAPLLDSESIRNTNLMRNAIQDH